MEVIDAGHKFRLNHLDGKRHSVLTFVKRMGPKFPGNFSTYEGTNLQEVLRAMISRLKYLDRQERHPSNYISICNLRQTIFDLERRAAERHNRPWIRIIPLAIETLETCPICGHIFPEDHNHPERKSIWNKTKDRIVQIFTLFQK